MINKFKLGDIVWNFKTIDFADGTSYIDQLWIKFRVIKDFNNGNYKLEALQEYKTHGYSSHHKNIELHKIGVMTILGSDTFELVKEYPDNFNRLDLIIGE